RPLTLHHAPMMGEQPLLTAFIIIILGGLGSIPGAILGGLILGLIDSIVATALGAEPAFLLSFVFIILLLLFRPTGLFGHAPSRWHRGRPDRRPGAPPVAAVRGPRLLPLSLRPGVF